MSLKGNMMTTIDVMKYLKPGAIVPVDVQTTALLVNALREALSEQPSQQCRCERKANGEYVCDCTRECLQPAPVAKPHEQEPVVLKPCWYESKQEKMCPKCGQVHAEAIPPAQRTWVNATTWRGLTDEQVIKTFNAICNGKPFNVERILELHRAIEAKLKEKNCG
jgi:hypothetical protein